MRGARRGGGWRASPAPTAVDDARLDEATRAAPDGGVGQQDVEPGLCAGPRPRGCLRGSVAVTWAARYRGRAPSTRAARAKSRARRCALTTTSDRRPEYDRRRRWPRWPSSRGSPRRCRSSPASCCRARTSSARGMAEHLYAAIPELAATQDDELRAELLGSTEANIAQVLRLLAHGASIDDVVVPHEALAYMRGNVRRGIPLAALLRSYRLGHAWLWERWSQALQERVEDSGELAAGQDQQLGVHVRLRRQGLRRPRRGVRERARADDAQHDPAARRDGAGDPRRRARRRGGRLAAARATTCAATTSRCGSPCASSAVRGLERAVEEAAAALGAGEPLVVPSGAARFDAWCGVVRARPRPMRSNATSRRPGSWSRSASRARGSRAFAARTPRRCRRRASGRWPAAVSPR